MGLDEADEEEEEEGGGEISSVDRYRNEIRDSIAGRWGVIKQFSCDSRGFYR